MLKKKIIEPLDSFLLFGLWRSDGRPLVFAAEFYADRTFYFSHDLIIWNTLPKLVFVDDLRFLADFGCEFFLSHSLLISTLLNKLSNIHSNALKMFDPLYRECKYLVL